MAALQSLAEKCLSCEWIHHFVVTHQVWLTAINVLFFSQVFFFLVVLSKSSRASPCQALLKCLALHFSQPVLFALLLAFSNFFSYCQESIKTICLLNIKVHCYISASGYPV